MIADDDAAALPHDRMDVSQEISDRALLESYLEGGCADSLNELVGRHLGDVRGVLFSMVLDDAAADDLAQEVFVRAVRGLATFQRQSEFGTWLYRIAMNVAYSYLRRQRRSPVEFAAKTPEPASKSPLPEQEAGAKEFAHEIETALAALAPAQRAAIVLTCLQGKSPEEAAEIEGCTVKAIYCRVHAARQKLKTRLQKHLP